MLHHGCKWKVLWRRRGLCATQRGQAMGILPTGYSVQLPSLVCFKEFIWPVHLCRTLTPTSSYSTWKLTGSLKLTKIMLCCRMSLAHKLLTLFASSCTQPNPMTNPMMKFSHYWKIISHCLYLKQVHVKQCNKLPHKGIVACIAELYCLSKRWNFGTILSPYWRIDWYRGWRWSYIIQTHCKVKLNICHCSKGNTW